MADQLRHYAYKLEELRRSGRFSDLTLFYQGSKLEVHKSVLACHSEFFAKMLDGLSGDDQEAKLDLEGDSDLAVEAMVEYMYKFDYDPQGSRDPLAFHLDVHAIADKYEIPDLAKKAKEKFISAARYVLKQDPIAVHRVRAAICTIYSSKHDSNKELRDIIVKLVVEDLGKFKKLTEDAGFRYILRHGPGFGSDIALGISNGTPTYQCSSCEEFFSCIRPQPTDFTYCPCCGDTGSITVQPWEL